MMASTQTTILFTLFVVILIIGSVRMTYITYSIQYECNQSADRRIVLSDSKSFSAIVLRSNEDQTQSNQKCKVRIVGTDAQGFILTVNKLLLNSSKCQDYVVISDKNKWCDSDHAITVTTDEDHFDIEFNTGSNSSSEFEVIVTAVDGIWNKTCPEGTIRCDGGQQYCIYNGFECDGKRNCPSGSDEKDCPNQPTVSTAQQMPVTRRWKTLPLITNSSEIKISQQWTKILTKAETRKPLLSNTRLPNDRIVVTQRAVTETATVGERQFVLHVSFTRMALVVTLFLFIVAFIGGIAVCKYRKHYNEGRMRSVFHYRPLNP